MFSFGFINFPFNPSSISIKAKMVRPLLCDPFLPSDYLYHRATVATTRVMAEAEVATVAEVEVEAGEEEAVVATGCQTSEVAFVPSTGPLRSSPISRKTSIWKTSESLPAQRQRLSNSNGRKK